MILKRYINSEIARTSAAILLVLILIFVSSNFIKLIQLAVNGTISSSAVFGLMGLQIPAIAGFLLPLSFYIAILLTFGRLYSEHEMAVINSVGVGEYQLAKNIMPVALILALISGSLSLFMTPWSSYLSKSLMAQEKAQAKFGAFVPGRFQENSTKSGVVYVQAKDAEGVIDSIFVVNGFAEKTENAEKTANFQVQTSQSGRLWKESGTDAAGNAIEQDYLVLEDGKSYVFDPLENRWNITEYGAYFMRVAPPETESLSLKNNSIATLTLLQDPHAAEWAEIHWRLSAPLSIPILCFLAVPLARTQPRKGKFSRLFPAIMIYLVYALLMMNGRQFIETGKVPMVLGFWWIHLLAIALCFWLFRPSSGRSRNRSKIRNNRSSKV